MINNNNLEEMFLADVFFNDFKKMTQNQTVSMGLQTLATLFGAGAVALFQTNFWYSVVCAVICIVCYGAYELLP